MRNSLFMLILVLLSACNGQPKASAEPGKEKKEPKAHLVEIEKVVQVDSSIANQWYGSLEYSERVNIYNQEKGRIDSFPFREGDRVAKGKMLMHMDDRLLQAEKGRLLAQISQAQTDWNRIKRLVNKQAISAEELDKANTQLAIYDAEKKLMDIRLSYFRISAPFSGVVTERFANEGDAVSEQTHLLTLSNYKSLVAKVQISESALPSIKKSMPANIIVPSSGDKFAGKISRIYPKLHPTTRQATVEIIFDRVPDDLYSGQSVLAEIEGVRKQRLLIPLAALKRDAAGEHVYRLNEESKALRQAVISANYIAGKVEITQGLKSGDKVITRGFLGLNNGKTVKIAGDKESALDMPQQDRPQLNSVEKPDQQIDQPTDQQSVKKSTP